MRNQGQEGLRKNVIQAGRLEKIIQRSDLFGCYIVGDGFLSGMGLPGIGRIIGGETGGQNSFGVCSSAAGNGRIDECDIRILGVEDFDHRGQTIGFSGANPPGEDFDLRSSRGVGSGRSRGWRSSCRGTGC